MQTSRRDPLVLVDTANLSREDWLAYRMFSRLRPDTKVLLVGDADQLESVGAGSVFRELICSIYRKELERTSMEQVQILTPFRSEGAASVNGLNEAIREEIDPAGSGKPEVTFGGRFALCRCAV